MDTRYWLLLLLMMTTMTMTMESAENSK